MSSNSPTPVKAITWQDFSEEERKAIQLEFDELDSDHDGFVKPNEVRAILEKRSAGAKVSDKIVQDFFATFDKNDDKMVSFEEYKQGWVKAAADFNTMIQGKTDKTWDDLTPEQQQNISRSFKVADEDNNGYIDATELRKFFEFFYGQPIPDDVLNEIMDAYDKNHDNKVSFEEFKARTLEELNDMLKGFVPANNDVLLAPLQQKNTATKATEYYGMSDEHKHFIKELFATYDENKDGKLDKNEIRAFIEQTNGLKVTDEMLESAFKEIDTNQDGTISYEEFSLSVCKAVKEIEDFLLSKPNKTWEDLTSEQQDRMRKSFKTIDANENGVIDAHELKKHLSFWAGKDLSDDEFLPILAEYDTNKDGVVSWEEFKNKTLVELNALVMQQ